MRPPSPPYSSSNHRSRSRSPADVIAHHLEIVAIYATDIRINIIAAAQRAHVPQSVQRANERPQVSRCIGIFGLSSRTTAIDIRRIFTRCGHIDDVILVIDNKTNRSRGYCFVYFDSIKSAIGAVESSVDLRIHSRSVRVDFSLTHRPRSSLGRDYRHSKYDHSRSRYSRSPYY